MELKVADKRIRPNFGFAFYFVTMFCLYTNTYIQLIVQMWIIGYCFYPILKRLKIKITKTLSFFMIWYALFTALVFASRFWAYSTDNSSKTTITIFRICIIGFMIFIYANTKEKALSLLLSFIIGCMLMCLVALITTIVTGGTIGTTTFGVVIGQHRNQIGAIAAPLTLICFCLQKAYQFRFGNLLASYFLIFTLISGSRTSILQVTMLAVLYALFEKNISKRVQNIGMLIIAGIIVVILMQEIPYLYNTIWVRIENAINTILGNGTSDSSAKGRSFYKAIAWIMFLQKPLLGFGLDGFKCYLRDHPYIMGIFLNPVYSHCNYAELAADFGVLGLIIWYVPMLRVLVDSIRIRKDNTWTLCLFCTFVTFIVSDYSRFPWDTHLVMYMYFCIVLLIKFEVLGKTKMLRKIYRVKVRRK